MIVPKGRKEGKHNDDEGTAEDPPGDGGKEPGADRRAHRQAEEKCLSETASQGADDPWRFPLLKLYCRDKMKRSLDKR